MAGLPGGRGDHQDRGQDRPDARRPAGGESQSDQEGTEVPCRLAVQMDTLFSEEDPEMELAAVVLFSSVVLWFVEEAADEHI